MRKIFIFISFIITSTVFADKITVDGIERTYVLHVPESVSNPAPLVFMLHGGGGNGKRMIKLTGFNEVSDKHGFIVCYPDGIDKHWNDGRKVNKSFKNGVEVNDVKFISLLIDSLESGYSIDSAGIFVCGISNGGMMSFRLGCELNDRIAAIAPVAISMSEYLYNSCKPVKPVPLMYIFGNEDPLVPYEGGSISFHRGRVVSVENTLAFWGKNNGCSDTPVITSIDKEDDDTYVKKYVFSGESQRNEIVFYLIYGGGHTWPGGRQYLPEFIVGRTSDEFNASGEIWKWFEGKKLE